MSQAEGTGLYKPAYWISPPSIAVFSDPLSLQPSSHHHDNLNPMPSDGYWQWDGRTEPATYDLCSQLEMFDLQVPSDGPTLFLGALGLWEQAAVKGTIPE